MSPIYIRPAREQAEHDRLILFLEAKYQKKFEVLINKGESKDYALKVGTGTYFPDLILQEAKKPAGVIEIETGESTNNLEALAQWVHFGKARVPFHLYVPVLMYDAARRFCEMHQVTVTEIWTYRSLMDGFDLVRVFHDPQAVAKSGKGPVAKVVAMPKQVEVPRSEPAIEAVEEILAKIGSREAAKAAAKAAARPSVKTIVKSAVPVKPAAPVKPVAAPAPAPAPAPSKAAAPAPAKPAPVKKAAAPAKPTKPAKPATPVKKSAKPAPKPAPKPVKKAAAKKPVARKVVAKKAAAKPVKKVKAAKPVSKPKPAPKAKAKPKKR